MKTEELIAALVADTRPVARGALTRRLSIAAAVGGIVAFAAAALAGLRPDFSSAILGLSLWMKAAFTVAAAMLGFFAIERASRPGARLTARLALLAVPFILMIAIAIIELAHTAPSARVAVWLGHSWRTCAISIVALSIPALALLLRAMRRLAPTRPAAAGFSAGLLAGGLAATAYGLHCPETSAAFVATWYALGILGVGVLGALAGLRFLRW